MNKTIFCLLCQTQDATVLTSSACVLCLEKQAEEVKITAIRTTGLAGGLLTPYKGLLPALESKDSSNGSPAATSFTY